MEHNLYEVLGLARDASPEQIRKAYRKKALETHPDRLPPDATDADKSASAEKFRAVNNAYEVLIEPKNRRTYDLHGVWPPPEHNNDEPHHRSSRHRYEPSSHQYQTYSSPFPDNMFPPFSSGLFGERHPRSHFVFTDPFALFDSIFGDFPRAGPVGLFQFPPRHAEHHSRRHEYLGHPADEHHHYEDPGRDGYTGPHHRRHTHSQGSSYPPMQAFFQSESHGYGSHGRWTQESKVTTTVNGVSQSVWKRTDADGNVHVTKTYPDGREKYTVNGIEQPTQRQDRYISRNGYGPTPLHIAGNDYAHGHPPPPYTPHGSHHGPRSEYNRSRERVIPDLGRYGENIYPEDQKRRWWRR